MQNVSDIRDFYQSRLGRVAARTIIKKIQKFWPEINTGSTVLGVGYGAPYMPIHSDNTTVQHFAVMPASQGVIKWPWRGPSKTVLTEDHILPFDDQSVDYIIMAHMVENTENIDRVMKEAWRVLKSSGRLLVIVPNRSGVWARTDHTPFGHGKPYSGGQMRDVLKNHQFIPTMTKRALFFPPVDKRFILSSARGIEWLGRRFFTKLGGVTLIEATKQLYAVTPQGKKSPNRLTIKPPKIAPTAG